nr:PD-(D/E)XK motif protein [uncultured Mitsuokella sp.]
MLRKDTNGGQRLPELVNILRGLIKDAPSASRTFEEKIAKAGYLDAAEDYYQEGYTVRDTYSFEIKEGFPRIVRKNLPTGVYNLEYSVSIAQCMDYAIEAKDLLRRIKE